MFREMRRKKQEIGREGCVAVLKNAKRGVLSILGDDGYPYGIPLNHFYDEKTNAIYFHCAKEGHKIDAIKRCDKASFCVLSNGKQNDGEWFLRFESVVCFGKIRLVEGEEEKRTICDGLCEKFGRDETYRKEEWEKYKKNVACLALTVESMTGKAVKEE